MTYRTKRQKAVIAKARRYLKAKPWYSGVCVDNLPSEQDCKKDPRAAVLSIIMETEYWDGPPLSVLLNGEPS